jgi:hypothetical protein
MKYIKKYEQTFDNPRLQDLKDLLSHLIKVFNELGYDNKNYFDNAKYEIQFSNITKIKDQHTFNLEGEFSITKIFLAIKMRIGSLNDNLIKFIPKYFKTINGLELYNENPYFYITTFEIVSNLYNIIEQISIKDIQIKFDANKYNI